MSTDNPVVIDLGSESIKAGYARNVPSQYEPRLIVPSLVTVNTRQNGLQAATTASNCMQRVIDRGCIANFTYLESMLHYLLYEQLGWIKGEEGSVLFVEPLFVGKAEREELVQLMFESFNVMGMFVHDTAVCSLYAAGKIAGTTVDIGHGKIDIATVSEGVTNASAAARMTFAGQDLTGLLGKLLRRQQEQQVPLLQPHQLGALKVQCSRAAESADAFQQLMSQTGSSSSITAAVQQPQGGSSISSDPSQQQQSAAQQYVPQEYTLPDGTKITITTEGYQIAEALFNPTILGHHCPGLVDCIVESVNDTPDASLKRSMLENVLVCGGGSCLPNLGQRLVDDLRVQLPNSLVPMLCKVPEYMALQSGQYVPWVGGAVMAKLVAHSNHFLIKAEYEELGPSAVHRKCA